MIDDAQGLRQGPHADHRHPFPGRRRAAWTGPIALPAKPCCRRPCPARTQRWGASHESAVVAAQPVRPPRRRPGRWPWLLSLVTLAAGVALLGTSGWFLTAASLTTAGLAFNLFAPSALVRGFSFIRILARYGERLVGHDATLRLLADIRGWLFARLFPRLPLADRSLRHGDLVSRLTADVDALDTAFLVAIGPIAAALVIGGVHDHRAGLPHPRRRADLWHRALPWRRCGVPALLLVPGRTPAPPWSNAPPQARMAVLDGIDGHADLVAFGALGTAQADFAAQGRSAGAQPRWLASLAASASGAGPGLAALALIGVLWTGLLAHERRRRLMGPCWSACCWPSSAASKPPAPSCAASPSSAPPWPPPGGWWSIAEAPLPVTDPASPAAAATQWRHRAGACQLQL